MMRTSLSVADKDAIYPIALAVTLSARHRRDAAHTNKLKQKKIMRTRRFAQRNRQSDA
jgi:hypothetical protein